MTRRLIIPLGLASCLIAFPAVASSQIQASERGMVSQTIDGTTIALDYGRLQVRGRDSLFGGLVPWGKVWTPGANWATTIETNRDITINGHTLPAGEHSMWFEVQPGQWTAIFDPEPRRFHLFPPPVTDNQVRFTVRPAQDEHVEILTWSFPSVRATGGTLQMAWGTTSVTFAIDVQPTHPVTVARDLASRYDGNYRLGLLGPLGQDTVQFDITYQNDRLVARWENPPVPALGEFWLTYLGEGMFLPVELEDGEVFNVLVDLVLEFTPLDGRATKFEIRALGDELWGIGRRSR